ncbi:MAG: MaoC family dehydratase N-terminal domain-containing protein [Acidimicrobiales bacterium]
MSDLAAHIGRTTAVGTLVVERAPLTAFARAVHADDPVYRNADAARAAGFDDVPAPPTFGFSIRTGAGGRSCSPPSSPRATRSPR